MKTRNAVLASALALGAALFAHGCADDRASVQIQMVCFPTDDCTFSETCGAQYIGWVTLDTTQSANDVAWLFLQVENQLPDNSNANTGRLNTNDAHIDEVIVEYEGFPLPKVVIGSNFTVLAGGTSVISVEAVTATGGAALDIANFAGELLAKIRLGGYYDDGTRFETGEFPVTIRVCAGCVGATCGGLATCPPSSEGQLPITCM